MKHLISAIVVSYHTGPDLWACLEALKAEPLVTEVLVLDNGNPPQDSAALEGLAAASGGRLKHLIGHGNVGFARGCNMGAALAQNDLLFFVNPDCAPRRGAVLRLAQTCLSLTQTPAIVGGRILNSDGSEQRGGRRDTFTVWRALVSFSGLSRLERLFPVFRDPHRERDPVPDAALAVGAVSGAMMMLTRSDFESLGGFDEGYFLHVEDLDICRRALEAGGSVWFEPGATAVHAQSTSSASSAFVERHKAAGFRRYFRKFAKGPAGRVAAECFAPLVGAALTLRLLVRGARGGR